MRIKRYSTADKAQILNDLSASGQILAAFCRDRELSHKRICRWLCAETEASGATSSFARVDLLDEPAEESMEVWFGSSMCVRFAAGTAPATIAGFEGRFRDVKFPIVYSYFCRAPDSGLKRTKR